MDRAQRSMAGGPAARYARDAGAHRDGGILAFLCRARLTMLDRRMWFSAMRVVGALIVVAAGFQLFFRYAYIGSGPIVIRIDRVTGASCFMPCRPTPAPSPSPAPSPPTYAEDDQRAIALAQRQTTAIAIEAQHADDGYEWTAKGRYTSDYARVASPEPNVFDSDAPTEATPSVPRPYGWITPTPEPNPFLATDAPTGPASIRVVCFCSKTGFGWRWEVHLYTREVYEINGNRDLMQRYRLQEPTPAPSNPIE